MKLDLTSAALEDLRSISAYTLERWGPDQEARYLSSMWDRFETLLADPTRLRSRPDLFSGCRMASEGKHVILFRVQGNVLQVVRVLHSAMDFKRHIPRELLPGK